MSASLISEPNQTKQLECPLEVLKDIKNPMFEWNEDITNPMFMGIYEWNEGLKIKIKIINF